MRFVVLEHEMPESPGTHAAVAQRHWDFIVETPDCDRLPTWRLAQNPLASPSEIPAERIQDHRPLYLDYQGEVSGGRGTVRRLERGTTTIERLTANELRIVLAGTQLRGRFEIVRAPDGGLVFRRAAAEWPRRRARPRPRPSI